ncbi:MAG: aminotransferase class V-fold PLP-dependent enzyme [Pyrinomonadaceae bacterium]|nr:aminotransferase class V-fold PLP-dependent enzyme [Pyrinomonadaceae bacterium]
MSFDLDSSKRKKVWNSTIESLENFYENTGDLKTSSAIERGHVQRNVIDDFDSPKVPEEAIEHVIECLKEFAVHTPHPDYFGLFNPRANFPSIVADTITATFNPQMAAWSHAPFASEVEDMLIHEIGKKFGYADKETDGVFTSGGAEANLTAVLCAINFKFPSVAQRGVAAIGATPKIYCSTESHHTVIKSARICGLGTESITYVPVDEKQEMVPESLESKIKEDIANGHEPFLIFATLGTTGSGGIDPIRALSRLAAKYGCWLHADAAWGGAVALTKEHRHLIEGIELADSITFDAHKWLSVPMAASLFITRHSDILRKTFSIETDYMPADEDEIKMIGSYSHSIQWSRRFIGLKLYLSLLVFGWEGYDETISHQLKLGEKLKENLLLNGWKVLNNTSLPVVCFSDERFEDEPDFANFIANRLVASGNAWVSTYPIDGKATIRACITNYASTEQNTNNLVELVNLQRETYIKAH